MRYVNIPSSISAVNSQGFYSLNSPETIDGYTVTAISTNAIQYTSSVSYLKIVIPNTILTIDLQAIYYYQYLRVYSDLTERPIGWNTSFGYNYWNSNSSESDRVYYWQGQWLL